MRSRSSNATIPELTNFLKTIRTKCQKNKVTNLQKHCSAWNIDWSVATVLRGIGIVEKLNGRYKWVAEKPNENMAHLIRETANEYKQCSI